MLSSQSRRFSMRCGLLVLLLLPGLLVALRDEDTSATSQRRLATDAADPGLLREGAADLIRDLETSSGTIMRFERLDEAALAKCPGSSFSSAVASWYPEPLLAGSSDSLRLRCEEGTLLWTLTKGSTASTCSAPACNSLSMAGEELGFTVMHLTKDEGKVGSCAILCHLPPPYHVVLSMIERLCTPSERVYMDINDDDIAPPEAAGIEYVKGSVFSSDLPDEARIFLQKAASFKFDHAFSIGCMPAQCPSALRNVWRLLKDDDSDYIITPNLEIMDGSFKKQKEAVEAFGFEAASWGAEAHLMNYSSAGHSSTGPYPSIYHKGPLTVESPSVASIPPFCQ